MSVQNRLFRYTTVTFDRQALILAALFAAVMGISLYGFTVIQAAGATPEPIFEGQSATNAAAAGGAWAIAEALLAGVLLVLLVVWRQLPEWVQDAVSTAVLFSIAMYAGARIVSADHMAIEYAIAVTAVFYLGFVTILKLGLWWVVNNLMAIGLAILLGLAGGLALGVPFLVIGMIGLALYDHYFANEKPWMFTLGRVLVDLKLPVLIVIPSSWRLDWDELAESVEGKPDDDSSAVDVSMGIGMADVALPSMFAVAVAAAAPDPNWLGVPVVAWGVLAGVLVACLRLRWVMINRGSGAGLPALATGSLGGWVIGLAAAWVLLL